MPPKKKVENTINIVKETFSNHNETKPIDSETKKPVKKESKKKSIIEDVPSTTLIKEPIKEPVIVEEKKKTKNIKKEKVNDSDKEVPDTSVIEQSKQSLDSTMSNAQSALLIEQPLTKSKVLQSKSLVLIEQSKQSLDSTIKKVPSTFLIEQHAKIACSTMSNAQSALLIEQPKLNQENVEKEINEERNKFKILLESSNKIEKDLEVARNNFKKLLNESNEIEKNLEITRTNLKNLLDKLKINDNIIDKNNIKKKKETTIEISDTD
jgi:hypothetical protein